MILRQKKENLVRIPITESAQNVRLCFEQCLKDSCDDYVQIAFDRGVNEFVIKFNIYENIVEYK